MKNQERWGIIGGGILGLTLAYRLSQKGYNVVLYEASPEAGGLANSCSYRDFKWDRFYHVIMKSDSYLRNLLSEIGIEERINWVETKTGFFCKGKFHSMSGIIDFMKFPLINIIDKTRLALTILYASYEKNWRKLEKIPVDKWLIRWSGKNNYEKIWQPLLRAKLGELHKSTSAAFIWATIQRMYAARKNGYKKEMFGYMPGGYYTILKQLLNVLGNKVCIETNHNASKISVALSGKILIDFSNGRKAEHDHVISTIPSSQFVSIFPQITIKERNKHKSITYMGVICLSLVLKKALSGYYITNITDLGFPFTGVIEMSALVDPAEFNDKFLVYLPKYVPSSSKEFLLPDKELFAAFFDGLKKMYPNMDSTDVLEWKVAKARCVFALPKLNYSSQLPSMTGPIKNLHSVNSACIINGTLNINETIKLAETALNQILNEN